VQATEEYQKSDAYKMYQDYLHAFKSGSAPALSYSKPIEATGDDDGNSSVTSKAPTVSSPAAIHNFTNQRNVMTLRPPTSTFEKIDMESLQKEYEEETEAEARERLAPRTPRE